MYHNIFFRIKKYAVILFELLDFEFSDLNSVFSKSGTDVPLLELSVIFENSIDIGIGNILLVLLMSERLEQILNGLISLCKGFGFRSFFIR